METSEEIKLARDIMTALVKSKKALRMYPVNNPIYAKTVETTTAKIEEFLDISKEMKLKIKQNDIFLDSESVYHNPAKDDNLALFFFKDGLREISFLQGVTREEIQGFLEILAYDFDMENVEDDVVTLLWEKDFQKIKYVVDENVLVEDEQYEKQAEKQARDVAPEADDLTRAYDDAFRAEDAKPIEFVQIGEDDLKSLARSIAKDSYDRRDKLVRVLFHTLEHFDDPSYSKEIISMICTMIGYAVQQGSLEGALGILKKAKNVYTASADDARKKNILHIFAFAGSPEMIKQIGENLDRESVITEPVFNEYVKFLPKAAISPFMTVLGELKTINARKMVINALIYLGRRDIASLAKGLRDERWYVVRNIIYILRMIGDKRVVEHLVKASKHSDVRVRKEVLKAVGEMGNEKVIPVIKEHLDDPDASVRAGAARALSSLRMDAAKRILMDKLSESKFDKADFSEKKEFYESLATWKDESVFNFMMRIAKKTSLFNRARTDENRACAAYALGIIGNPDALPILQKLRTSNNKLVGEYAYNSIRRIEHGK